MSEKVNLQEAIIKYFKDNRLIKNNEKGCDVPSYLFDINEDTLKKIQE